MTQIKIATYTIPKLPPQFTFRIDERPFPWCICHKHQILVYRLSKMSKAKLLEKYMKDVNKIKKGAKEVGLNDKQIDEMFRKCFDELKKSTSSKRPNQTKTKAQRICSKLLKIFLLFTLLAIFIYILLRVHQPTSSFVLRNVQSLTYPTMKIIRYLSVPIIKRFPSLTYLYDETCLIENPFFYVYDMECWPCEDVQVVLNLTGMNHNPLESGSGTPFYIKTNLKPVTYRNLQRMYKENQEVFDTDAQLIKSTNSSIHNPYCLFNDEYILDPAAKTHTQWRINRMVPARFIRQLFPRPEFLPDRSGQSVERFVMVDGAKAEPYILPNTECSYIFVIQGSGERTIILKPSAECSKKCRTVSVQLKPSYVLWYNWWYWRPISLPTEKSTGPSISYINSYC